MTEEQLAALPCPHCGEFGHEPLRWSLWGGWFTRFTGWRHCPWCDRSFHPQPDSGFATGWWVLPMLGVPLVGLAICSLGCFCLPALG